MSMLFSKPDTPAAPTPTPPVPTQANVNTDMAARQEILKMIRGRSATLMTGGGGLRDLGRVSSYNSLFGS